jgi:hypothetical protein
MLVYHACRKVQENRAKQAIAKRTGLDRLDEVSTVEPHSFRNPYSSGRYRTQILHPNRPLKTHNLR